MESGLISKLEEQQQQCYSVRVSRKERVAAVLPLQEHWLPLSSLDLLVPPIHFDVFSCYKKPPPPPGSVTTSCTKACGFSAMVSGLKAALAQTLVSYYALAGEVVTNSQGEPELLCDNRGVEFIEAHADIELKDLCLYNPDESVEGKLVPTKMEGLLCVQATELKCGGIVVACMFDHRVADAYSANMFLVAWVEAAGGKPIAVVPSFRRSLLSARRPGCHDESLNRLIMPLSSFPKPPNSDSISRIYYVSADDVEEMQAAASTGSGRRSKLVAFSAFLWGVVGKAAAKHAAAAEGCRMGIVVDGRARLGGSMSSYFGNVLSIPHGSLSLDELGSMELCRVADEVHEFLSWALTEEHFRGIIDRVEAIRPEKAGVKIYLDATTPSLVVSSGQRFPVGKLDFGWGTPAFSSYHFPWGSSNGYVMPMPMAGGEGHWVVYVHLPSKFIEVLEAEAGHVFRRLTSDHLGLTYTVDTTPKN